MGPFARDRPSTVFSDLLEQLLRAHPELLAASFVDEQGECVDYATRLSPYDAQVLGAQLAHTTATLARARGDRDEGALLGWTMASAERALIVQRATPQHCVVVLSGRPSSAPRIARALPALAGALRREGELAAPPWESPGAPVEVEIRGSSPWNYAPRSYLGHGREPRQVEVLGRYLEAGVREGTTVCFRVRVGEDEFTLVHAVRDDRWFKR